MEKTYKYRFSRRAIYWTLVYLVVFVLLGWLLYHLYEGGYLSAWFTSFIVALIALMSLSIPRRIVVTDEKVEVRCLLDITEIRRDEIASALKGTDMVFITAGMGGGTGTGAAPVVAQIAKELGILTIGIVTKPFSFEGKRRMAQAEEGIENLTAQVDSIVVVPNDRLHLVSEQKITLLNAFEMADDILRQGIQSISELIKLPSLINLDFADVTAVMKDAGAAHMGVGKAEGREKAEDAAKKDDHQPAARNLHQRREGRDHERDRRPGSRPGRRAERLRYYL